MGILATVYYHYHQIIVEESKWTGNITVKYDGKKISSKNYLFGRKHMFDTTEDGQHAHYEVSLSFPYITRKVTISRNGVVIFSQREGFVSPPVQREETAFREREIVREIVLVVCPNCAHRNESSRRTCEKCGASI